MSSVISYHADFFPLLSVCLLELRPPATLFPVAFLSKRGGFNSQTEIL